MEAHVTLRVIKGKVRQILSAIVRGTVYDIPYYQLVYCMAAKLALPQNISLLLCNSKRIYLEIY